MNKIGPLGAMQRKIKGRIRKRMPATEMSEDDILVKTIVTEHNPEEIEYDVRPMFHIVEDALRSSTMNSEGGTTSAQLCVDHDKDRSHRTGYANVPEALSAKIDQISSEISYKARNGVDAHSTTVAIFEMLTMYEWDVKIVLALAAFTLTYGEFWLLAQIHDTYQIAKTMAILKQLPSIIEDVSTLKPRFDTLNDLVKNILEVTKCVIEFHHLPSQYSTLDIPDLTTANDYIPVASYWTVRSIVACAALITSLTPRGQRIFTSTDASDLSTLTCKLKNMVDHLRKLLNSCHEQFGENVDLEAYQMLRDLFSTPQTDNMNVLKALIYPQDDILPLYDGVTKKRVSLEPLRCKNVLLLFSSLEVSSYERWILEVIYKDSKAHGPGMESSYEWVWIPILDPNSEWIEPKQKKFEFLQENMPWYSVYHPSLIGKPVIWFIQSEWKYNKRPILVVLDPQGRVSCPNAIHMMRIWGNAAYPFTISTEEALWKEETWRLELLVCGGFGLEIFNWIKDGKYIFLYGGDDPQWVRRFVKEARRVATATQIPLEMVYVGESTRRKKVQQIVDTIIREKLGTKYWSNHIILWYFWTRLQSMFFSKIQLKRTDDDDDHVMKEIKKLLSYDKQGGWIVLARGSRIVLNGHATTGLKTLVEYDVEWKEHADRDGFEPAFMHHYNKLYSVASPCCRLEFSPEIGGIPERLTCPECGRNMRVLISFQCCHDDKIDEDFFVINDTP